MAKDLENVAFKQLAIQGTKQVLNKVNPLDALNVIAGHVSEWQKVKEQEKTKRHAISAQRDILVQKIQADRDLFLEALRENYKERAVVYSKSFDMLDKAIESGQIEIAQLAMTGILEQIKNNPLPSFGEFKQSFLSNQPLDF
ncbi:hypothetical protein V2P20_18405 [Methylobacter sp. Wu1]|uniref:hypothetical protein n=1 Tax=Methylobacter sp. Wu1 TaxID=3119359 RepID=UPI002F941538